MILLIDRNSNATWLMTLPLPAVTPKTVAKLTQNSEKQKVLTDIFLVFNIVRLGQLKSLLLEVLPFWKKLSHYLHAVVSIAAVSSTHF